MIYTIIIAKYRRESSSIFLEEYLMQTKKNLSSSTSGQDKKWVLEKKNDGRLIICYIR